jgi:hypothetical protein
MVVIRSKADMGLPPRRFMPGAKDPTQSVHRGGSSLIAKRR